MCSVSSSNGFLLPRCVTVSVNVSDFVYRTLFISPWVFSIIWDTRSSCLPSSYLFNCSLTRYVLCCAALSFSSLFLFPLVLFQYDSVPVPRSSLSLSLSSPSHFVFSYCTSTPHSSFCVLGWLAESGIKTGEWLYRPEPSTVGYHNVTSIVNNATTTTLVAYDVNNDILMRSAFSHFYQMDKIGIFRQFFATLFPILLIIVMFLVTTNVLNYILVKCKLDYMQMGTCKNSIWLSCQISSHLLHFLIFLSTFHSFFSIVFVNPEKLEEGKRKLERYRKTTVRRWNLQYHCYNDCILLFVALVSLIRLSLSDPLLFLSYIYYHYFSPSFPFCTDRVSLFRLTVILFYTDYFYLSLTSLLSSLYFPIIPLHSSP